MFALLLPQDQMLVMFRAFCRGCDLGDHKYCSSEAYRKESYVVEFQLTEAVLPNNTALYSFLCMSERVAEQF
jgi:hypothetical protein